MVSDASLSPEQRKASLVEDIEGEISILKQRFADADKNVNPFEMTSQYEWSEIWLNSLEKLLTHAKAVGDTGRTKKARD